MKDDGKTHFCAEPCPAVSARKLPAAHWAPRNGPPAQKSAAACSIKVLHVNSTRQSGGVAEILSSLTPLLNDVGIETEWLVIDGAPELFTFTKDIHNALHGEAIGLSRAGKRLHREIAEANAAERRLDDYDLVIVHDPQPLPLIEFRRQQTWIWCCHIDLSASFTPAWNYRRPAMLAASDIRSCTAVGLPGC